MTSMPRANRGFTFADVSVALPTGVLVENLSTHIDGVGLTCVAGPSGSGKSTLLRLCNRLEVPTSGQVLLDGADLASLDPLALRRRVGMVFQRPVTFAGNVVDNLLVADPVASAVELCDVLERVGLDSTFLPRRADELSGGEAQRMCIARTLLTRPEVLLLDEPTAALDVDARGVIEAMVRRLVAAGLTAVWVTHDLAQAERIADRTIVVVDGKVVSGSQAATYLAARSFAGGDGAGAES